MKTKFIIYTAIVFMTISCHKKNNITRGKGKIEISSQDSFHIYRAGNIVDIPAMTLKKYNLFTYINASCASCLPKFEILNSLYLKAKRNRDISFYCISYSKDNFELLKFLVEDKKMDVPQYDIILHSHEMEEKPEIVSKLNTTFITDKDFNILYEADIVDHPETFQTLLDKLH